MQRFHLQDEFTDPCAEQCFIAAIAHDCTLYWELFDLLSPNLFTKEAGTWERVKLAIEEGQQPVVPHDWEPTTVPHAVAHRLADLYRRRLLAALQERVAEALFDANTPATEIATLLEEETFRVQSAFREPAMGGLLWASDLLPQVIADAEARRQQREHTGCAVLGLPSGIPRLDLLLNGLNVESIVSLPGFGLAPKGHWSYRAGFNMRARRTQPWSVRGCIDPIPPKG